MNVGVTTEGRQLQSISITLIAFNYFKYSHCGGYNPRGETHKCFSNLKCGGYDPKGASSMVLLVTSGGGSPEGIPLLSTIDRFKRLIDPKESSP